MRRYATNTKVPVERSREYCKDRPSVPDAALVCPVNCGYVGRLGHGLLDHEFAVDYCPACLIGRVHPKKEAL